jgi:lysine-specific permease
MNGTVWRIILFFVGAIFIMGLVIPYDDPNLSKIGGVDNIAVSPFTLVFVKSGIPGAEHIMNAVILTTIMSAGNSGLYLCTRILWTLAMEGKAPRVFRHLTQGGIPIWCLTLTTVLASSLFGLSFVGNQVIYTWLVNMTSVMGFIAWLGIAFAHWRFRRAYILQGYSLDDLVYKALWFPVGPILASLLILICVFGQGYSAFMTNTVNCTSTNFDEPIHFGVYTFKRSLLDERNSTLCTEHSFNVSTFVSGYVILPVFLIIYLVYKCVMKTRLIPLQEIDLITNNINERAKRDHINT